MNKKHFRKKKKRETGKEKRRKRRVGKISFRKILPDPSIDILQVCPLIFGYGITEV
jgi:hypothetical protein